MDVLIDVTFRVKPGMHDEGRFLAVRLFEYLSTFFKICIVLRRCLVRSSGLHYVHKGVDMRAPWNSPDGSFSWTTLWLNLACAITCARFLVGTGIDIGGFSWQPGEMDAALPGAILATLGALYWGRRGQDDKLAVTPVPALAPVAPVSPEAQS